MDRQAVALFGGIVAVGLGPAVWLGGTLLRPDDAAPVPAPAVVRPVTERPSGAAVPELASDPLAGAQASARAVAPDAGVDPEPTPAATDPAEPDGPGASGTRAPSGWPNAPWPGWRLSDRQSWPFSPLAGR